MFCDGLEIVLGVLSSVQATDTKLVDKVFNDCKDAILKQLTDGAFGADDVTIDMK